MPSTSQEIVFITGANTGLGLAAARALLRDHGDRFHVFLGSRSPSQGEAAVKELHDQGLKNCEAVQIDVTSNDFIAQAAKYVEHKFGRLDVLHVNVSHVMHTSQLRK